MTTGTNTNPTRTISSRPMGGQQALSHWGAKSQKTYSQSWDSWTLMTEMGLNHGMNRSEVLEVISRWAHQKGIDLVEVRNQLLQQRDA